MCNVPKLFAWIKEPVTNFTSCGIEYPENDGGVGVLNNRKIEPNNILVEATNCVAGHMAAQQEIIYISLPCSYTCSCDQFITNGVWIKGYQNL